MIELLLCLYSLCAGFTFCAYRSDHDLKRWAPVFALLWPLAAIACGYVMFWFWRKKRRHIRRIRELLEERIEKVLGETNEEIR